MARARAKFDKMWRIWYAILVLLLQFFLVFSAFQRYGSFRRKALRESWHMGPMNFYLTMMLAACLQLPIFAYFTFVRTRNYAEEGVQLGKDENFLAAAMATEAVATGGSGCLARMRRHFLPYTCVLHLLMALCLLVPLPVLEAAEIYNEKLPKSAVWRTNLDFLLAPTASARNAVSVEVFNLLLALFILVVRYPTVFWYTNRLFSFLFSVMLFFGCLHVLLSYEACSVLVKAAHADAGVNLAPAAVLTLHCIGDLLLLFSNVCFFEFGLAQVTGCVRRYRRCLQLEASGSDVADESPHWWNYVPQLSGVLMMVMSVVLKTPVLWDWVGVFSRQRQPILLAAVLTSCGYFVLWMAAWIVLVLRSWHFKVRMEATHKLAGFHDNSGSPERTRADSDLSSSKQGGNHYVFVQRDSMIPTISEQVDCSSDNSYEKQVTGQSTYERQNGLVKYQVQRRNSQVSGCGSLRRGAQTKRPTNRVTFKETEGSPDSSQTADSGFGSSRQPQATAASLAGVMEVDDYARVNRTPVTFSNYDDCPMFGSLFREPDYCSRQELQAASTYASHSDIYGRLGHFETDFADKVPDLLISRSPYDSLSRNQQGGYAPLPPPPPDLDDTVDTLCSQV